ncbi:hypothetical protein [Paraburkholderia phytofirmans]|uniref:hypothetical protein n=1 Tax=Paraburkholderia phytofirmans TaxID=261302 RepID=UPI0038BB7CB7
MTASSIPSPHRYGRLLRWSPERTFADQIPGLLVVLPVVRAGNPVGVQVPMMLWRVAVSLTSQLADITGADVTDERIRDGLRDAEARRDLMRRHRGAVLSELAESGTVDGPTLAAWQPDLQHFTMGYSAQAMRFTEQLAAPTEVAMQFCYAGLQSVDTAVLARLNHDIDATVNASMLAQRCYLAALGALGLTDQGIDRNPAGKGGKARAQNDPKQGEKRFVYDCWQDWKAGRRQYKSNAAFAVDMLDKCEHVQSVKSIETWCTRWGRGEDIPCKV